MSGTLKIYYKVNFEGTNRVVNILRAMKFLKIGLTLFVVSAMSYPNKTDTKIIVFALAQ